jgi:hypothetical protein
LQAVIMRCLEKLPELRFAANTELDRALGMCRDSTK